MEKYINQIINADCLDILRELPDKCVDCCITDPPYGTTACKWDSVIPFEPMWKELNRVMKDNGAICLFGSEPFSSVLRCSNLKMFRYDWIWVKNRGANFANAKKHPLKFHEIISVFSQKTCCYFPQMKKSEKIRTKGANKGYRGFNSKSLMREDYVKKQYKDFYPRSLLTFGSSNHNSLHPTQKPVELIEYLVKTYTLGNEIVLDFCSGSGTTAVACHNLHRRFICIEKDPEYWKASIERLEKVRQQMSLF